MRTLFSDERQFGRLTLLLLLIAAVMGLRILFAAGFIPVDDAEYARAAARFLDGSFSWDEHTGPPVNPGRLGLVLPLMAMFTVLGPSEISLAIYPLILSLITTVIVYLFSARLFGAAAGFIAVCIWMFIPLDIDFAAKVDPDTAVTAFAALAIYAIYCARTNPRIGESALLLRGASAGLAFGAGWLCKASIVYFGPFCLLVLGYDLKRDWRRFGYLWAGVAAGSISVFAAEMIYYLISVGDAFFRFHIIEQNYQLFPQYFFNEGARWGYEAGTPYWKAILKRLFLDGPMTFFLRDDYMYLPTIGLIASAYGIYKRDRRFYFMAALLVSLLLMFNFFSASLVNYQPLPLFTRYSHALCFAGTVLTAGLLAKLVLPHLSRTTLSARPDALFWGVVVAAVLTAAGGWSTFRKTRDTTTTWASAERTLAEVLQPNNRIYTDALSRASLEFFWEYPPSMNVVNIAELEADAGIPCNSFVLINNNYVNWLTNNFGMWYTFEPFELPDVVLQPPETWRQTWTNGIARLYEIECG